MALKLIATYSKRLGLPEYSSHQFSVCVETEINSIDDVAGESARLYQTLQRSVDEEIQSTGFVPQKGYGQVNGSAHHGSSNGSNGEWQCSEKQQELILKLIEEHKLDRGKVEDLSRGMFGVGVKELNKLQASGLIDGILRMAGESPAPRYGYRKPATRT